MNTKTYYQIILDRSGSMESCIDGTMSGFNEQIQMICDLQRQHPEQEVLVSLTIFNQQVDHLVKCQAPNKVMALSRHNYTPDGMTALHDAIGESVMMLKSRVEEEVREDKASIVVVIITDGLENSSKLFGLQAIRRLIRELEDTGKWTFNFMGADMDAAAEAEKINIRSSNAMSYRSVHSKSTFSKLADNMQEYMEFKKEGKVKKDFLKKE